MCYRMLTPYSGGPDISHIDTEGPSDEDTSLAEDNQDNDVPLQDNQGPSNLDQAIKKARAKRKGRRRTSSSGKRNSMSISESVEDSTLIPMETKDISGQVDSTRKDVKSPDFEMHVENKKTQQEGIPAVAMEIDEFTNVGKEEHRKQTAENSVQEVNDIFWRGVLGKVFTRHLKGEIRTLFDPFVNAMGWWPYRPSRMEVSYCTPD